MSKREEASNTTSNEEVSNREDSTVDSALRLINPNTLAVFFYTCLFGVYLYQGSAIYRYALNIPYWDEWENITRDQFSSFPPLAWLFKHHNEHLIVVTKLQIWLAYKINGWNLVSLILFNYLLYGAVLVVLYKLIAKRVLGKETYVVAAFLPFVLSFLNWSNNLWAFQSNMHFCILFLFLGVYWIFYRDSTASCVIGALCMLLSGLSSAGGIICGFGVFLSYLAYTFSRRALFINADEHRKAFRHILILGVATASATTLWSWNYAQPGHHPDLFFKHPWWAFIFYANLLSLAFGYETVSLPLGVIALGFILVPLLFLSIQSFKHPRGSTWGLIALVVSILGTLLSVSITRAGFGIEWSKSPRYLEIGSMLVPITAIIVAELLKHRRAIRRFVLLLLFSFAFVGYVDNWSTDIYRQYSEHVSLGFDCIQEHLDQTRKNLEGENKRIGALICPTLNSHPISEPLAIAQEKNLSFLSQFD